MSEQPATYDGREVVYMTHPEVEGTATTSREAFDKVWREKGWVEAKGVDAEQLAHETRVRQVAATLGIDDVTSATKAQLVEVAGQLGRTVPAGANKAQLEELVHAPESPEDGTTTTAQE